MTPIWESREKFLYLYPLIAYLNERSEFIIRVLKQIEDGYKISLNWSYELKANDLVWDLYNDILSLAGDARSFSQLINRLDNVVLETVINKRFDTDNSLIPHSLYNKNLAHMKPDIANVLKQLPFVESYSVEILSMALRYRFTDYEDMGEEEFDNFEEVLRKNKIQLTAQLALLHGKHFLNLLHLREEAKSASFVKYHHELANLEKIRIRLMFHLLLNAISLVYINLIWKIIPDLRKNKDIFTLIDKLQAKGKGDDFVIDEFYPIYQGLYKNTLDVELTRFDWQLISFLMHDGDDISSVQHFVGPLLTDVESFQNRILRHIKEELHVINSKTFENFFEFFSSLVKSDKIFRLMASCNDHPSTIIESAYLMNCYALWPHMEPKTVFSVFQYRSRLNQLSKEVEIKTKKSKEDEALVRKKQAILLGVDEAQKAPKTAYDQLIIGLKNVKTGEAFERFLKQLFDHMGYHTQLTPASGDQGADLIISKNNQKTVVQAKFYTSSVGNKAVQEVLGARGYYQATKAIVVTNSHFTASAVALASANAVTLIDGNQLIQLVNALSGL